MTFLVYLVLSIVIFFFTSKISYKLGLLDIPRKRKLHSHPTPYTGGVALFIILILSIKIFDQNFNELNTILSFSFFMMLVGLIDDKFDLNVGGKLSLQLFPISYIILASKLYLTNIGNYEHFEILLGNFSIPFTIGCVFFLINATNYFDGFDGILTSTILSVLVILSFLTYDIKEINLFIKILTIPLIVFLFFNFSFFNLPKTFLGDGGSLGLGFVISFLIIFLTESGYIHQILGAWSISLIVFEFISLNIIRILKGQNLFLSGNDHLHHILFDKIKSDIALNIIFIILNLILFFIGYFSFVLFGPLLSLLSFLISFMIFFFLRFKISHRGAGYAGSSSG